MQNILVATFQYVSSSSKKLNKQNILEWKAFLIPKWCITNMYTYKYINI